MRAARELTCLLLLVGCGSGGTKSPGSGSEGSSGGSSGTPGTCCAPLNAAASDAGTTGNPLGGPGEGLGPGGSPPTTGPGGPGTPPGASGDAGTPGSEEGGTTSDAASPPTGPCSMLNAITDYENAGPFMYTAKTSGSVKMWVPTVPAGCKIPMVHLANGTGATCADYQDDLNRLASHGFLALCYEDPNTGAGTQGIQAYDAAIAMFPDLVDTKIGSTGHSQGGQAAFVVLQLAEAKYGTKYTYAGLAMEPASGFGTPPSGETWQQSYGKIKSPMFMFSGTADVLVSAAWVGQAYSAMNPMNEVYWWSATGATHIPTPQVPEEQVSIPWFRWKLLGDQAACKFFKAMPGNSMINPGWTKVMSENEAACQ